MGALLRFKRETGHDVGEMKGDLTDLITLFWCCTASACSADEIPFDLSLERFADCLGAQDVERFGASLAENASDIEKKTASLNQ